jgi:hypothetical protein
MLVRKHKWTFELFVACFFFFFFDLPYSILMFACVSQDYETALNAYRMVVADNKEDKAWRQFAGAQEMMGLCLFMYAWAERDSQSAVAVNLPGANTANAAGGLLYQAVLSVLGGDEGRTAEKVCLHGYGWVPFR